MTTLPQEAPQRNSRHGKPDPEPIIIAEWPINKREMARVSIEFYKGTTWLINLRKWFEADDGELRPGKGIALGVKNLPQLTDAMEQALATARERGLIPVDQESGR
jgi:hypothetical protein